MRVGIFVSGVALGWAVASFGFAESLDAPWADQQSPTSHRSAETSGASRVMRPGATVSPGDPPRGAPPAPALSRAVGAGATPAQPPRCAPSRLPADPPRAAPQAHQELSAEAPADSVTPSEASAADWSHMPAELVDPWSLTPDPSWVSDLTLITDPWGTE